MSLMNIYKEYDHLVTNNGWNPGDAAVLVTTGYDISGTSGNHWDSIKLRLGKSYGPAVGGLIVSEGMGNSRGAFNSGFGIKANRFLPWFARL